MRKQTTNHWYCRRYSYCSAGCTIRQSICSEYLRDPLKKTSRIVRLRSLIVACRVAARSTRLFRPANRRFWGDFWNILPENIREICERALLIRNTNDVTYSPG